MIPLFLIAGNFVREQRWPLITLLLYVLVFGGGIAITGGARDDVLFFLRSAGIYGLAFSALLAASAINNERRSRRILAVLSKSVERGQYLGGLLLGVMLAAGVYCVVLGALGTAALARHESRFEYLWLLIALLMPLFLFVATAALLFSTFLHPLFATGATAIVLGGLGVIGNSIGGAWKDFLPALTLVNAAVSFGEPGWHVPWTACVSAVAQAGIFWGVATLIFSRRDIAVAVE